MRLGYCCHCLSLGKKAKFKTMRVSQAEKLSVNDRYDEVQKRTRHNFSVLYDIMKWNIENNINMYRVSSDLAVLHTHDICDYDFRNDSVVLELCDKIKNMAKYNDIRLTIHPSQYSVINSDKEHVFQNTIISLQYHYDLMQLLGIDYMCLHVGGKTGGVEAGKERFVENFMRLPQHIQKSIMLENDDKSYNVEDTLELCETLDIPVCVDFHHDRVLGSTSHISVYIDRIMNTWNGNTPVSHLSSSADEDKIINKHHDYIMLADFNRVIGITNGKFDIEFECKKKDLALLEFINSAESEVA